MEQYITFGEWVRRRRKLLDLTQADLARMVNCSLSMLRKIERDERRPSKQLAELLSDHLAIGETQRGPFLKMARGQFFVGPINPTQSDGPLIPDRGPAAGYPEDLAPFVGRDRELDLLHRHLNLARQGQGRMVFIAGEAGQGKTSLLNEFARQAVDTDHDLLVAGGSSDLYTGQSDPLMPFRDTLRMLVGDVENSGLRGILSRELSARLAGVAPETIETLLNVGPHVIGTLISGPALEARLAQGFPHHPKTTELLLRLQSHRGWRESPKSQDLQQGYFFDEISSTLKALAQRWPFVLMLDDLQWLDQTSASLMGHLAMRVQHSPILVVGAYRPEDLVSWRQEENRADTHQHPLQEVLSESQRRFGQNRINLDFSDPGEELEFVNALLDLDDNDFDGEFREQLAHLTEGHPLYVVELVRDMKARGELVLGVDGRWVVSEALSWRHFPARVEGVIEKRIARLPEELRSLLTIGSVQGETFYAEVIALIRETDPRELTRRLSADLDRDQRLIREQGVRSAGLERLSQYRFRHHLFQKYLYGRLADAERMYLHEAVGIALEALFANHVSAEEVPAIQLARHFQEARLRAKASRYLLQAGQNAFRVIAYDEAAAHFESGLLLLEEETQSAETLRLAFDLSLNLARAYWHGGRVSEAISANEKSIEIAQGLQDSKAFARAVLAYEEPRWRLNLDAEPSQQFMRQALAVLGEEDSGLQVRLLVNLAGTLLVSGEQDELHTTLNKALQIARRIDDQVALCDALRIKAQIDRRPETTTVRLEAVQEMITTAESIGDIERLADALDLYIYDHLELGHIELVDQAMSTQKQVSEEIKQPFQLHIAAVLQTMRALLRGEFDEAERLAHQAADLSRQIGLAELDGIFGIHMFTIRWEQGRLNEIAPLVKFILAKNPESTTWRPGLALIYRTLGQRQACRALFDELVSDSLIFVPQDSLWVTTLAYLTEVCTYLGDIERADHLYGLLLPYRDRTVVVGGATACYGAAARYLGMLARTKSDWTAAEQHFEDALRLDERMGAWPWLAHSQCEYGAMLLARGHKPDRAKAETYLADAWASAQRMGMGYLTSQITDLRTQYELASTSRAAPERE